MSRYPYVGVSGYEWVYVGMNKCMWVRVGVCVSVGVSRHPLN